MGRYIVDVPTNHNDTSYSFNTFEEALEFINEGSTYGEIQYKVTVFSNGRLTEEGSKLIKESDG